MADPYLLIDGYNLMHAAGMARLRYGPGDLERCRKRFLKYLQGRLTSRELPRTSVVFDAGDAPTDMPRRTTLDGMQVFFAKPGGDADSLIEELIAAHSAPRQVRLISSDHRLQKAAPRTSAYEIPELSQQKSGGRNELMELAATAPRFYSRATVDLGKLSIEVDKAGTSAVAVGEATLRGTRRGGEPESDARTVSLRFDKIDGDWQVVSLSVSAAHEPPTAPP